MGCLKITYNQEVRQLGENHLFIGGHLEKSDPVEKNCIDYYPGGSVAMQYKKELEPDYRFGYQGQFAEEDGETGFNHFELRDYDPLIWRTNTIDPFRQFASSYNWVGNNPVIGIDPTGGECPTCPKTANYDYYRSSPTNYGYDASLGGNGTFQRLQEIVISAPRPLTVSSMPSWMTHQFARYYDDVSFTYKAGFNNVEDMGVTGTSIDFGSLEILKTSLSPHELLNGGGINDLASSKFNNNITQGVRIETGEFDVKFKINYAPTRFIPSLRSVEFGVGAPFVEMKATYNHNGVHQLRVGTQEDFGGSANGHAFTGSYFSGFVIDF